MTRRDAFRNVVPFTLLLLLLLAAGCSSAVQVKLPPDMVPYKDASRMLDFKLPPGWEKAEVDPVIEANTKKIRRTDPVAFRKGDKGWFAVWCDLYDSNRGEGLHLFDVIDAYAPLHKPTEFSFEVEYPGATFISRPMVYGIRATHVEKGEKREFLLLGVRKLPPVVNMHKTCTYLVLGRSASNDTAEEIRADISAVAATLNN